MKKIITIFALTLMLTTPILSKTAEAREAGAGIISLVLPGSGEWYNSGFKGAFPWAECIIGKICCLVGLSSMFDAAAGKGNGDIRLDFWSAPK